ncbi:MAG: prolipoprotein diacylglyceryl transferase [Elusimicrobiota bacterium]
MFPTLIRFGDFRIATYGLLVAAGYLVGLWWLNTQRERMGLSEKHFWGVVYAAFFGAIAGGKLLYWAVEWRDLLAGDLRLLRDFRYGFVYFGGLLGAFFTAWLYQRRTGFDYLKTADYFALATAFGHALGRLGCLAAGCCAGRPTTLPWGIRFDHPECLVDPRLAGVPLHPTQLYESAAEGLIAAALYRLLRRGERGQLPPGTVLAAYVGLYAAVRFVIEFFRGDDRGGFFLAMSVSQWVALGCLLAAAAFIVRRARRP